MGRTGTTTGTTSVDCDQLNDVDGIGCFCDIDVHYEYVVTNNADEPKTMGYLLQRTGGFYNYGKDDEDLSVDIKFLSEAFNPTGIGGGGGGGRMLSEDPEGRFPAATCTSESVIYGPPFDDGMEDTILAPNTSVKVKSSKYSVDICSCPTFVFGAAATASQVGSSSSSSKSSKGITSLQSKAGNGRKLSKAGTEPATFFEFGCAAADARRTDVEFLTRRGDGIDGRC